jgi:ABC-2 type transport system permease protein
MTQLMQVEFFKLRKRMMTWVLALLLVGLIILLYSVLWSVSERVARFGEHRQFTAEQLRRALFVQGSIPYALQIIGTLGTLLAIILAAGAAGSEYAWGTVRLMATASSGRIRLVLSKLIVVFALTIAGVVLGMIVAVGYSAVITYLSGGTDWSFVDGAFVRDQSLAFGRTLFVMAPYITLAFAAAIVGRSTLAGVGAGLGVAFIEPLISGLMREGGSPWHNMPNYLIGANIDVISAQNKLDEVLPRFGPDAQDLARRDVNSVEGAFIVLGIYIIAFIAIALIAYRRRDITAGSGG